MKNYIKRNKMVGFTLVELLAVIVIIGLIIIIAVPKVLNTLNNSKKRTFELTVKSIAKTAEEKYLENEAYGLEEEITCESVSNITSSDFSTCKIKFDNEGKAKVTLVGKGKYKGLNICNGTKSHVTLQSFECEGIINFSILGKNVQAEAGMTWREWVLSEYNNYTDEQNGRVELVELLDDEYIIYYWDNNSGANFILEGNELICENHIGKDDIIVGNANYVLCPM